MAPTISLRSICSTAATMAACLHLISPASAGSLAEPIMAVEPTPIGAAQVTLQTSGWTGAYIGGSLGYTLFDGSTNGANLFGGSLDGASYGAHAGYNHGFGKVVVGGELQYEATDVQEGSSFLELDSFARAKVRVGYDFGKFLPYATAGVASAKVSSSSFAGTDTGALIGLGVDYQVGQNLILGAEVIKNQFGNFEDSNVDLEATNAALRLSFRF
jgi:outer membrane immunogenic protein